MIAGTRRLLLAGFSLLLMPYALGQEAAPSAESLDWTLALNGTVECAECSAGLGFRIGVVSRDDGAAKEIVLRNRTDRVTELRIYKDVGIVRGDLSYGGDIVTILDLMSGEVLAGFHAYSLNISPDNRYFIYRKWFPRFGQVYESAVMIYDLALHDTAQRRLFVGTTESAGFRFFPGSVTYQERNEESLSVITGNGVLWNLARKRAFLTVTDASDYHSLVVLNLWGAPIVADYPPVCLIPFMPRHNRSVDAPEDQQRDMVVGIRYENDFVAVDMNHANGIEAGFRINYLSRCP